MIASNPSSNFVISKHQEIQPYNQEEKWEEPYY
jgi:hypothetical protein